MIVDERARRYLEAALRRHPGRVVRVTHEGHG